MMYWNDGGTNGWGIGLMTVGMLLLWALAVLGVIALVRYLGRTAPHGPAAPPVPPTAAPPMRPTPEQLLAERLARGEIDPDEYRARLATLRGVDGPVGSG
ncbi:SHOCT domain-containing protein [Streptomyces sp. LS1784]|uniref:SHOCT domain-containing protein n=1 Tax=Streptomyces sp. LS1784 TaxID=2851533 RepID=UPI001CCD79E7|nr:SHOCT domain-containing protein [Streptomyces sp. LS1784]